MGTPEFGSEVAAFVRASIPSVWTLELLLLLRRECGTAWSVDRLTQELRASRPLVVGVLAALGRSGLVAQEDGELFRYAPASAELGGLVDRLARAHAETPFAVLTEIARAPNDKIQGFADAFRLKRE